MTTPTDYARGYERAVADLIAIADEATARAHAPKLAGVTREEWMASANRLRARASLYYEAASALCLNPTPQEPR